MTTSLPTGTVTFLFTDIEGSTERWEHHRESMQSALERHDALLRDAIDARRGYVFKTVGDAFCAAFHTPHDALLAEGRMILLLDAFNEMPAASEREFRERVGLWKDWLVRLAQSRPGNRVVFSCRTLDYSAPLSTPALRVPQVQIESLSDAQVEAFLRAYSPVRGADIWAADVRPSVRELLDSLPPSETLPPLPQTGWEETTVLAAVMSADAESFIRGVMATNLALAGRCAAQMHVGAHGVGAHGRAPLPATLLYELRWALVARSRDGAADLRARIAAGLALGRLGDPRFERREGPHGVYLMPPVIEIPGGVYPIGEDEPILNHATGVAVRTHMPRHQVAIPGFQLGQFPLTNAEYACFMAAGGYDDERWWDTEAGRAWRRGEGTAEGAKQWTRQTLRSMRNNPRTLEAWYDIGQIDDDNYEEWQRCLTMTEAEFEAHLALYPSGRETEPRFWRDERYNNPLQPVVGISWYEARAYCTWLGRQTGLDWSPPSDAGREFVSRGVATRAALRSGGFPDFRTVVGGMRVVGVGRGSPPISSKH